MDIPGSTRGGKVFALIIAIDKYFANDMFPPLSGCVNDAKLFQEFLVTYCDSHRTELHTAFLINEAATRSGILSAFQSHLLANPNIPDHGMTPMILRRTR
ncbi:hypothetical protein FB451DRAFT_1226667 [Mycena latifolia]|nr:hypothetical protein FB451DRAFT_1226667 [Mycena latifolia]